VVDHRFLASILGQVNDAIIVKDLNGIIVYWNDVSTQLFGYTSEEMIGNSIGRLMAASGDLSLFESVKQRLFREGPVIVEAEMYNRDGNIMIVETHQSLMMGQNHEPEFIICVTRNISKRIRNEYLLRESEKNLSFIFESVSQSFILMDTEFRIITYNQKAAGIFRHFFQIELATGNSYPMYQVADRKPLFLNRIEQVLAGKTVQFEDNFEEEDGKVRTYGVTYFPVIRNHKTVAIIACGEDKTDIVLSKQELEKSEKKYRDLVESSMDLIWKLDTNGTLLFINETAVEHYGWRAEEILGRNFLEFIAPDYRQQAFEQLQHVIINRLNEYNYQHKILHKNGQESDVLTHASIRFVIENGIETAYISGTTRDISDRVEAERMLNEKNEQLRKLSSYLQQIREDERSHIAREIHDELGQQLTGIKMDMSWILKHLGKSTEEIELKVKESIQSVDNTIKMVRRIASELRPGVLDELGLIPALEWQSVQFENRFHIQVKLHVKINNISVDRATTTSVFRIYQEALTNIARHSKANAVEVEILSSESSYLLIISDNGIGVSTDQLFNTKTLGILGMKERAAMTGGHLTFSSEPNKGTHIVLEFPKLAVS
jgi:PAS domain S-box-containing protein